MSKTFLVPVAEDKREIGKVSLVLKAFPCKVTHGISVCVPYLKETVLAHLSLIENGPTVLPWPQKLRTRSWILGNRLLMDHIGRAQQSIPVFFPEESYGQRSLAGYRPWGCKESDMTDLTENTQVI